MDERYSALKTVYQGKTVLITGGLGFIGSNLARRLVDLKARVLLVDSLIPKYGGNLFNVADFEDRLRINIADVRDEYGLRYLVRDQDYIFNLAGQVSHTDSMVDPYTDLEINVRSQLSLLEACRHGNPQARIIFAGTRQIYGRPDYLPVDEEHPVRPVDVNGINKMAGEWYHLVYHGAYGLKTAVLRLTNTYGPRMRIKDARQTFAGWWIRQVIEGQPLMIYGNGRQLRDFNYVGDVVEALLTVGCRDEANGQIYNLGGRRAVSLLEFAELLIQANGGGQYQLVPFPEDRKTIDIGNYHGSFAKIKQTFGWEPKVGLAEGLAKTVDFYRQHMAQYT